MMLLRGRSIQQVVMVVSVLWVVLHFGTVGWFARDSQPCSSKEPGPVAATAPPPGSGRTPTAPLTQPTPQQMCSAHVEQLANAEVELEQLRQQLDSLRAENQALAHMREHLSQRQQQLIAAETALAVADPRRMQPHDDGRIAVLIPHLMLGARRILYEAWPAESFALYPFRVDPVNNTAAAFDGSVVPRQLVEFDESVHPDKLKQRQQKLDFIMMFREWHRYKCGGRSVFLVVENDMAPCDGAADILDKIMAWARGNMESWQMFRLGVGFNGLILKCDDVPALLHRFETEPEPVDVSIEYLFEKRARRDAAKLVFRFNLFSDTAQESTIWEKKTDEYRADLQLPRCYDAVWWPEKLRSANFQRVCDRQLFSPCDEETPSPEDAYSFSIPHSVVMDQYALDWKEPLRNVTSFRIWRGRPGRDCTETCARLGSNMQCDASMFPLIDNCNALLSTWGPAWNCVTKQGSYHPSVYGGLARVSFGPGRSKCHTKAPGVQRLCPCLAKAKRSQFPALKGVPPTTAYPPEDPAGTYWGGW